MRKHLKGTVQTDGGRPANVELVVHDEDPLIYSIRDLPISSDTGVVTIDIGKSNFYHITLTENVTSFVIIGPMKDKQRWDFETEITQDSPPGS